MRSRQLLTIALCVAALGSEGVVLEWIGKSKVVNHHLDVPCHVLEKKWDHGGVDSGNMVIKGDNLLALKALLPLYAGKVKCIYIDPPYNTGNEGWIYNDNVNDPTIRKWLGEVVGKEGEDFSRHDKWLCMMYPRLKLLHRLLADNGVIFISIDDVELYRLKLICDEIFGPKNFVANLIWKTKTAAKGVPPINMIVTNHDYILVYSKGDFRFRGEDRDLSDFSNPDNDPRGLWKADNMKSTTSTNIFAITNPLTGKSYLKNWAFSKDSIEKMIQENRIIWPKTENGTPRQKRFLSEMTNETKPLRTLIGEFQSETATNKLNEMFNGEKVFDFPKHVELLKLLIGQGCHSNNNEIILDSFIGSGATAQAVLELNKQDGGNRKFIGIEMMDYAETLTAERIKKVIDGYIPTTKKKEDKEYVEGTGGAFSFYELGEPLMVGEELNEKVATEKIREYIYYTEVNKPLPDLGAAAAKDPYLLGVEYDTAYYFCYEKGKAITLDRALLKTIKTKADQYVIYADKCALGEAELRRRHITFKKIPRDITRL